MALDLTKPAVGNPVGTDIDQIRANFVALDATDTAHAAATAAHGVAGAVVGTTDTQTLTNKTIVAASNTITTAASGDLSATELNAALAELQAAITALESTVGGLGAVNVQTGYFDNSTVSSTAGTTVVTAGTGEDLRYVDVTLASAVSGIANCDVRFEGGASSSDGLQMIVNDGDLANPTYRCAARLTSTTNLRVSCSLTPSWIEGRWYVIDHGA